jgi:hypothetical protein
MMVWSLDGLAQAKKNSTSTPAPKEIQIGFVDNSKSKYQDGCGCSFWLAGKEPKADLPNTWQFILVGNYEKQAWMNIDGKIVQLRLVSDTTRYKGKKGDRYFQVYQSRDVKATVECVANGFGDTHAVFCDAAITVVKGTQKKTVKAEGSCGC